MKNITTVIVTGTVKEIIDYVRNSKNTEGIREMINLRHFERELRRTAEGGDSPGTIICDAAFSVGDVFTHFAVRTHGFDGWYAGTTDFVDEEGF